MEKLLFFPLRKQAHTHTHTQAQKVSKNFFPREGFIHAVFIDIIHNYKQTTQINIFFLVILLYILQLRLKELLVEQHFSYIIL